jgi:hypothetical protein
MTRMRYLLFAILAACSRASTPPATATATSDIVTHCDSSAECRGDSNGCVYCYNGQCSCTLPAQPISDAGVDAAK